MEREFPARQPFAGSHWRPVRCQLGSLCGPPASGGVAQRDRAHQARQRKERMMGVPKAIVEERIVATGIWKAKTALHLGGESFSGDGVDMPLLRTAKGALYIPGSSIAGAARNYLARVLAKRRW